MKLKVENLCVDRGERRIVSDVSFELVAGEMLIVTGENGSGKSTLLRAISGLLPIAKGSASMDGKGAEEYSIGELCHYLGHKNAMKDALSVRENLLFWQEYCGDAWMTPHEALDQVDLLQTIDLPFGYLSAGQKRRTAIAKMLVSEKPLWVIDEPTAALDAGSSKCFVDILHNYLEDGGIVIAATHLPLGFENAKTLHLDAISPEIPDVFATDTGEQ